MNNSGKSSLRLTPVAFVAAIMLALFLSSQAFALFTNGDFEAGDLSGWTVTTFLSNGISGGTYSTKAGTSYDYTGIVSSGYDPNTGTDIPLPRFGAHSAVVNFQGMNNNGNIIRQTTTTAPGDVEADGRIHIYFAYAPVLDSGGHGPADVPYMHILLTDDTKGTTLYQQFTSAGDGNPNWIINGDVYHMKWQFLNLPFNSSMVSVGDSLTLEVTAAGCNQGGHWGYVYVDAFGSTNPGVTLPSPTSLSVSTGRDTGGDTVVINGSDFTGVTGVSVGGVAAQSFNVDSDTSITIVTPAHTAGTVSISITNDNGTASLPNSFTYTSNTPPTQFTSAAPPGGVYGATYAGHTFAADGVPTPTYSVYSGSLPPGINLSGDSLSGRPNAAGTYNFTIRAHNVAGDFDQSYSIFVDKAGSTSAVTRSVASPVYGQPLSLTATVSPAAPSTYTPAGSVQFYVDGSAFGGPVALNGSGMATSQTTTSLVASGHTYSATYLPDGNSYGSNTLPATAFTVSQDSSTTTVVSSAATSVYGQPFHLTATVVENSPSVVTPVGQVQFYFDGAPLGAAVSLTGGTASTADVYTLLGSAFPLVGSHTFSATYLGNSNTIGSASGDSTETVNKAPTSVSIASTQNPTVYGTTLDMTITVTANEPSIAVPAGSVRLYIDGIPFGSALTLNGSGQAVRTVPYLNLWPGTHAITARYTADVAPVQFIDSNNNASSLNQVVNKANPTFTFTPSANFPAAYQPVTYDLVVGPSMVTQGTPTGTVQFYVDGSPLGSPQTLDSSGKATSLPVASLTTGDHSITVSYSGDDYFLSVPTSTAYTHAIDKAQTTTQITSISPSESVVGQPVTVNVKVTANSPSTGIPNGTVTVGNGTDTCVVTLGPGGTGSCQLAPTAPGSPDLSAVYAPAASFYGGTSAPYSGPVVAKAGSSVTISGFNPASPVVGQPVTFSYTVSQVEPGAGTPTGSVTLSDGNGHSCTANVLAGQCTITFPAAGATSLSAAYTGDANFTPASHAPASGPAVAKASTSFGVVSSASTSVYGQPVHFTATLSVTAPGSGESSGPVQFKVDGANSGSTVALSGNAADSAALSTLAVGAHTFGADFLGDANYSASSATSQTQTINKADTTIVLTSSENPSPYGVSVLITATVTANAPSQATPGIGSVQFQVDGVNYGAPVALDANGKATKLLPYTALWVGSHTITGIYAATASFNGSDNLSTPLVQVVGKGDLDISLTPTVASPVFGQAFALRTTVSPVGAATPTPLGTVQFVVDGSNFGAPLTLDESSQAVSGALSTLPVGTHPVSVIYSGDDYHKGVTATFATTVVVSKADSAPVITGYLPLAPVVGQPVTVSFQVTAVLPGAGTPSGQVSVTNGIETCQAVLDEEGTGSCTFTPTSAGKLDLHVAYAGDGSFNGKAPAAGTAGPDVGPAATTVTITGFNPVSPVYGEATTVHYQVAAQSPSTLVPGGSVSLSNGTDSCSGTVGTDGSGSCQFTPSAAGLQSFTASFLNGTDFSDSASAGQGLTVARAETSVTVAVSINPVSQGAAVHFTAGVNASAPSQFVPQGQVQFYVDGMEFGSPVSLVAGQAVSGDIATLGTGNHNYSASYLGNANDAESSSASETLSVTQATSTTSVASSDNPSVYGEKVHFTATVSPVGPGQVAPTGQVQFYLDGQAFGSPVYLSSGKAVSGDAANLASGAHTFSAAYLGDANITPSSSADSAQTVNAAPVTVTISSTENPTVYGTSLDMTIMVAANAPSLAVPAGTVQLFIDDVKFASLLTLDGTGKAIRLVPYANLWPGTHAITAVYTPADGTQFEADSNNGAPYSQVVNKANPTFTFTPAVVSPVTGEAVKYSVTVGHTMPTQGTPTGTVQFYVDGAPSGGPVTLDAGGKATTAAAVKLAAGSHALTVQYSGDDYFLSVPVSAGYTQAIARGETHTSITGFSPLAAVVGQPVTVSVKVEGVAPASGMPSGEVVVSNGTDTCHASLDADGAGACQLAPTAPGSPSLTASYAQTAAFNASAQAPLAGPAVSKANATVSVSGFTPASATVGQAVTVNFSVQPVAPGFAVPTGSVTIDAGNGQVCTVTDITLATSCKITFNTAGMPSLSVAYSGDSSFNAYTAAAPIAGPQVAKAATSLSVSSSSSTSVYGQPVHFTATLSVNTKPDKLKFKSDGANPGGLVQFKMDGANLGDPVPVAENAAVSPDISSLAVGTHAFGAAYLGDANFLPSTADDQTQTVDMAGTTLVLESSLNPSPYGIPVLVTATVTANAPSLAVPNVGSVQFRVDDIDYGAPIPLDANGKATKLLPYTALWVGSHNVTAVYAGSGGFNPADNLSSPLVQVVVKGDLTIGLALSVDEPVFGQAFSLAATVSPTAPVTPAPTGSVRFIVDGGTPGPQLTLDGSSRAESAPLTGLSAGPHTVSIVYSGDDYYKQTTTVEATIQVKKADSAASLVDFSFTPAEASPVVGQPVTVTFKVDAVDPGKGIPSGKVTVSNGRDSCTATLAADGTGSCAYTPSTAGQPDLHVLYAGDDSFNGDSPAGGIAGPEVISAGTTVEIVNVKPAAPVFGGSVQVNFKVSQIAPSTLVPTGMVTINSGVDSCTAAIAADGTGSCVFTPSAAGPLTLTAAFGGDANFNSSASGETAGPVVAKADTAVDVTPSINPVLLDGEVHFTATLHVVASKGGLKGVSGSGPAAQPTGTVQFKVDGADFGSPVTLVNGVAGSLNLTGFSLGSHTITAQYSGNTNFNASLSTPITQKVVEGDLSKLVTPSGSGSIRYTGVVGTGTVTTLIQIPAGAVSSNTLLVFHQMAASAHPAPDGKSFNDLFTLEAYVDGALQPDFHFLKPLSVTITYVAKDWKESSLVPFVWDGSGWSSSGLEVTDRQPDLDSLNFTLTDLQSSEFALAGVHEYRIMLPAVSNP